MDPLESPTVSIDGRPITRGRSYPGARPASSLSIDPVKAMFSRIHCLTNKAPIVSSDSLSTSPLNKPREKCIKSHLTRPPSSTRYSSDDTLNPYLPTNPLDHRNALAASRLIIACHVPPLHHVRLRSRLHVSCPQLVHLLQTLVCPGGNAVWEARLLQEED